MPYWDHEEKITRSVFTMDRMFSFYVKTPLQGPAKVFFSGFLDNIATCPKKALYGEQTDIKLPLMCH